MGELRDYATYVYDGAIGTWAPLEDLLHRQRVKYLSYNVCLASLRFQSVRIHLASMTVARLYLISSPPLG